jgi:hypothetical protein
LCDMYRIGVTLSRVERAPEAIPIIDLEGMLGRRSFRRSPVMHATDKLLEV